MTLPKKVTVVEVGPRDGLQNESDVVATTIKAELIHRLSATGLTRIETTSFVRPDRIPQLSDADELFNLLERTPGVRYSALVPNAQGLKRALSAKTDAIGVFTAASETFNQKNINASINEAFARFEPIIASAKKHNVPVRGYISCALGCPYEGQVKPKKVADIARTLMDMGCFEISLGDTIGLGTVNATEALIHAASKHVAQENLALHFHNTRGQALVNILAALKLGIATFDASVGGLGGCPYAKGATGNVATEDLVYMLHGLGIDTSIDLDALLECTRYIYLALGRPPASHLGKIALNDS